MNQTHTHTHTEFRAETLAQSLSLTHLALEFHWLHSCIQRNKAAGQKNLKDRHRHGHQRENSKINREEKEEREKTRWQTKECEIRVCESTGRKEEVH